MKSMKERREELDKKRADDLIKMVREIVVEELGKQKTEFVTQVPDRDANCDCLDCNVEIGGGLPFDDNGALIEPDLPPGVKDIDDGE